MTRNLLNARRSKHSPGPVPRRQSPSPSLSVSSSPPSKHGRGRRRRTATTWTKANDDTLKRARIAGENWQEICDTYFPGFKTPNACRKRHERLAKQEFSKALDGEYRDHFIIAYFEVRQAMWSIFAEKLNYNDWQDLELKVRRRSQREEETHATRPTVSASKTWRPTAAASSASPGRRRRRT
jgi:hypothetical protein